MLVTLHQVKKVYDESNGMLAHYGRPLKDIPLRMDAGDLVLVRCVRMYVYTRILVVCSAIT